MPLPQGRSKAFEAAGKQAVLAGREAASAGLVSSADRAYIKPPSIVPRLDLGPTWPDVVYRHSAKIAEQTATVKAEMNGLAPGLDCRRPSH